LAQALDFGQWGMALRRQPRIRGVGVHSRWGEQRRKEDSGKGLGQGPDVEQGEQSALEKKNSSQALKS